jgi:hypothetical protein
MTNLCIIYLRGSPSCRVNSLMSALAFRLKLPVAICGGHSKARTHNQDSRRLT